MCYTKPLTQKKEREEIFYIRKVYKMPAKVLKKLLEDFKLNDEENLSLNDQGILNILEIPELSKK